MSQIPTCETDLKTSDSVDAGLNDESLDELIMNRIVPDDGCTPGAYTCYFYLECGDHFTMFAHKHICLHVLQWHFIDWVLEKGNIDDLLRYARTPADAREELKEAAEKLRRTEYCNGIACLQNYLKTLCKLRNDNWGVFDFAIVTEAVEIKEKLDFITYIRDNSFGFYIFYEDEDYYHKIPNMESAKIIDKGTVSERTVDGKSFVERFYR